MTHHSKLKEFKQPDFDCGQSFPYYHEMPSEDIKGSEGKRVEMKCRVGGTPFPKVSWKKGQWLQLDDGGRFEVTCDPETGNCMLAIKACRMSDVGKYRVVATNEFGELPSYFHVHIDKTSDSPNLGFKAKLRKRKVKQKVEVSPEEKEKQILDLLKKSNPKHYERICLDNGFFDFRMILQKLKGMHKVDHDEPEAETVRVMKKLKHVMANDEGTAVFETHLEDVKPDTPIKWLHNGEPIQFSDDPDVAKKHEFRKVGNVHQLIIRNVHPDDAGNYTMEIGKERFDAVLTVKEKPLKFDVELEDKQSKVHGRVMFSAVISQRGKKAKWYKDGKEIDIRHSNGRIEDVTEGKQHKLIVQELAMDDAGKYTCKIKNIESTASLTVTAPSLKFRHRLVNTEVAERDTAIFDCAVNMKKATAKWRINNKVIKTGGRYKITSGDIHKLEIKDVTLKDNNAKVEVSFGDAKSKAVLHVNAKPIKILTKLTNVRCKNGDNAQFSTYLDCKDDKIPYKWFKDDKPINLKSKRYEVSNSQGRYRLKIKKAGFDDEGHYSFQLRGTHQEATLSISSPPCIKQNWLDLLRKTPMRAKAGDKLEIVVPWEGRAPVMATWNNGRTTLSNHGRFKMIVDNDNKTAKLIIDPVKKDDSGLYEVCISNDCGEQTIEIPVEVLDKPDAPSGQLAVSDIKAKSLKLNWNSPIDHRTKVDGYVIEMKDPKTHKWAKVAEVPSDTHDYPVDNLKEGEEYQFRVMSKNDQGVSPPLESAPVTPLSPGEAPKVDPEVLEHFEHNPIFVKAGATCSIKIPCQGNPPPSVMWLHEDDEVIPSKHHRATKLSSMNEVELRIKKCTPKDAGQYEAKIFNNKGGIEVFAHVVVLAPGVTIQYKGFEIELIESDINKLLAQNQVKVEESSDSEPESQPDSVKNEVPDMSKSKIKFDKVTDNSVKISWDAPKQEEKAQPIKKYVVERCIADNYEVWEKVGEVPGDKDEFKDDKCKEDTRYYYRVSAVNDTGAGAPVQSSPVTCYAKEIPPSVDPAVLAAFAKAPMKVKYGQTLRINIPMSHGNPPPQVTWEKDGKPIDDDGHRIVVDHSDHDAAHLGVHKCKQDDAGKYVCKIKNSAGEVRIPVNVEVIAPPPKIKGKPKVSNISSKGVELEWNPVEEKGGLPVENYVIERKEEGRKVWTKVGKTPDAATCKFQVSGIPGKKYQYRIKAVNAAAEGEESDPTESVQLKDNFDKPGQVTGEIQLVDSTDESITIGWDPVTNDGGSPLLGYVVERRKKGQASWLKCNEPEDCKDNKFRVGRLQKNADYEFRVSAVNLAGEGDPSVPSRPMTSQMRMTPPGEPTNFELKDSTNTSATFGWKEADLCGGSGIIGYEIELKMDGEDKWTPYTSNPVKGNEFTVKGLERGKSYQARIRTVNHGAKSRWYYMNKNFLMCATAITPEFKMTPELELAARKGLTVNAGTTIRLHVPFHARPRPTIKWTRDGLQVGEAYINDMEGITQLQIRGTRSWHTGTYTVQLDNASGRKKLDIKVTVIDVPSAPQGPLNVSNLTESSVTLDWKPPKLDGGSKVRSYSVQKREAKGRDWATISGNVKNCVFTIEDLPQLRSFYFRVKAENDIGLSDPLQTSDIIFFKRKREKVQIEDLKLDEADLRKPPKVTVPLKDRSVPDGVKVTLSCSVSGKPYPNIRWTKNNKEICDKNILKENVIGLCRIVIKKTRGSDAGVYKCIASNDIGECETKCTLKITL